MANNNNPMTSFGQSIGNMFGGMLGGLVQGENNPFGELLAQQLQAGQTNQAATPGQAPSNQPAKEQRPGNDIVVKFFNGGKLVLPKKEEEESADDQAAYSAEVTLGPDNFNRKRVIEDGCYSSRSWATAKFPPEVRKIDFHNDGFVDDNFIQFLMTNKYLVVSNVELVDFSGCSSLTDLGVSWLAEWLKDCGHLRQIHLSGCVQVTDLGAASFQQMSSLPRLFLLGTSVSALPDALWNASPEVQGCPLLARYSQKDQGRIDGVLARVAIHRSPDVKYSMTSLLTKNIKEDSGGISHVTSWKNEFIDFGLYEAPVDHPVNTILKPAEAQQVLIPVNLEYQKEKNVEHILHTMQYHLSNTDEFLQPSASIGVNYQPMLLMSSFWDASEGRLLFVDILSSFQALLGESSDDELNIAVALFNFPFSAANPYVEFELEGVPGVKYQLKMGLVRMESGEGETSVTCQTGDIIRYGIEKSDDMEKHPFLTDEDHNLFVAVNPHLHDKQHCYVSYHFMDSETERNDETLDLAVDPLNVYEFLKDEVSSKKTTWTDKEKKGGTEYKSEVLTLIKNSGVVVVCASVQYGQSKKCMEEVQLAVTLKKPLIFAVLGFKSEWKATKLGDIATQTNAPVLELVKMQQETEEDHELVKAVKNLVRGSNYEVLDDSCSGGTPYFSIIAPQRQFTLKFLNHHCNSTSDSKHQYFEAQANFDEERSLEGLPIFDLANGTVWCQKKSAIKSLHAVQKSRNKLRFRCSWDKATEPNEQRSLRVGVGAISPDGDIDFEGNAFHDFMLDEPMADLYAVQVKDVKTFLCPFITFVVEFYKNKELVHSQNFKFSPSEDSPAAPSFAIVPPAETYVHMEDYSPPPWYQDEMCNASIYTEENFILPGWVGPSVTATGSTIRFEAIDTWLTSTSSVSVFVAKYSLSKQHPSFSLQVDALHGEPQGLFIAAYAHQYRIEPYATGGYQIEKPEEGAVYACMLDTNRIKFDSYGLPIIKQKIQLEFTCNGQVLKKDKFEYHGGGLHPVILGSGISVKMANMNLDKAHDLTAQSKVPLKRFTVLGTSENDSGEDNKDALESLKEATIKGITGFQEETNLLIEDVQSKMEVGLAGNAIRSQLELQKRNLAHLVESSSSLLTFTKVNFATLEGQEELCGLLKDNQKDISQPFSYRQRFSDELLKVVRELLGEAPKPKLLSRDECVRRWSVGAGHLAALFKTMHSWGKVIFLENLQPWSVVLDVDWFMKLLTLLHDATRSKVTSEGHVRCLHPSTPVWKDQDLIALAKGETFDTKKNLLAALLQYHQLLRLPAFRATTEDIRSVLLNPGHLLDKFAVEQSQFYKPGEKEEDFFVLTLIFKFPLGIFRSTKQAILCACAQLCPPSVLTPSFLVTQIAASQVVLSWQKGEAVPSSVEDSLHVVVKTFLPLEEQVQAKRVVLEYSSIIAHCFEDVISDILLKTKTPYFVSRDPSTQSDNLSICSSHRWEKDPADLEVSVCTLCANCSQGGMACTYNQVPGPYHIHKCRCEPHILCCQDCGLCQACVRKLWDVRSTLRPCRDVPDQMTTQRSFQGTITYSHVTMTPAILNEVSVVRTQQSDSVKAISIGLLSDGGDCFTQLFPGYALISTKDQGFHQKSRGELTKEALEKDEGLSFDVGDRVTVRMSEPMEKSLDPPETNLESNKEPFHVHIKAKVNCSLSWVSNIVRSKKPDIHGMVISHSPATNTALYFDVEIVKLSAEGFCGVGMSPEDGDSEWLKHGTTDISPLDNCEAWSRQDWQVGDLLGCGTLVEDGSQVIVFTHNDAVICRHTMPSQRLYAAVLVCGDNAVRILRNNIWKHPNQLKLQTESRMPLDQELYESPDKSVRICPRRKLLFATGIGENRFPSATLLIENTSFNHILWKVRTNTRDHYISNPNRGIIKPFQVAEVRNECKSAERDLTSDQFQIVWLPLQNYEVEDNHIDIETANKLWDAKGKQKKHENYHVLSCEWRTDLSQYEEKKETNSAEEIDTTDSPLVEPSYRIEIEKNGDTVASYWLPKCSYRFAIELKSKDPKQNGIHDLLSIQMPKLPTLGQKEGFRVGMTLNVKMDKGNLPALEEQLKQLCEDSNGVVAACHVDRIESADENCELLHLSFEQEPGVYMSLKLPSDSPRLLPLTQEDVEHFSSSSRYHCKGEYLQLYGCHPDFSRLAPRYLFKNLDDTKTRKAASEPYSGRSCQYVLFGVHKVDMFREHLLGARASMGHPTLLFLPDEITPSMLLHPSIQQLHDLSKLAAHPLCQVLANRQSKEWHLVNTQGCFASGHLDYSIIYRNQHVMCAYNDQAAKKVRLPKHNELLNKASALPRHQVEPLLQVILQTYALTAMLLAMPRYKKPPLVRLDRYSDWEPLQLLPMDFSEEDLCKTHLVKLLQPPRGPYTELLRHCLVCPESSAEKAGARQFDCCLTDLRRVEEHLSELPSLSTLVVQSPDEAVEFKLSGPELTVVVSESRNCHIQLKKLPKLESWTGPMMKNWEQNFECLARCRNLDNIRLKQNCLRRLPTSCQDLKSLTSLIIEESHLDHLPASFALLKNLEELQIIGPSWRFNTRSTINITMDMCNTHFPYVAEKNINEVMSMITSAWDGKAASLQDPEEWGKTMAAFYHLNPSLGCASGSSVHGGFPQQILQLTNLHTLMLYNQAFKFIPPQIARLENLEILGLDGCLELETLPATLGYLPLKQLSLSGCVSLRVPGREIVERGTEAVTAYLKQMARGHSENWRTKLMLVGIGGAGKTTLLRALKSDTNQARPTTEQDITHGIDIESWRARDQSRPGVEVTFSAWDFAGQTVFYNTHQFFLSDRAVYLLVWSTRHGFDNSGLEFWLSSIHCHTPDAPIFIIATHADKLTTDIPMEQLKELYPQIAGFHFVGSTTGMGIAQLKRDILSASAALEYMGESVPAVYLDLEQKLLSLRNDETPYIEWSVVRQYAMEAGIFDDKDVLRAVQFLHRIGSVQHFDSEVLKEYVVINPQWIVNAMASVVTFKDSGIKNGRLYHKHLAHLWKEYPSHLHEWLLRLTEMFDLTFQVSSTLSLVPCLLPHERPREAVWPPSGVNVTNDVSFMMIMYTFRYLPTGLFNRLQARLFEFTKGKAVWKNGSVLEKNGHHAFLQQRRDRNLVVQVLGQHPENILFLIHETMEDLINYSYRGISFDYLIPCPECVKEVGMDNPAMFEASLVREAHKLSAPYLQCRKLFHTIPMSTAKALMPPDDNQELDLQLQKSMQSLVEMRSNLSTDIFMLFSTANFLSVAERAKKVDPRMVIDQLKDEFTCFYDEDMDKADTQVLMVSMQEAKTLLVFISNEFVKDARCSMLLQYAHRTFGERLLLVNLSADYGWRNNAAGFILGQKIFINMKNYMKDNFKKQMEDLKSSIRDKLQEKTVHQEDPVCFLSYSWNNSKTANALRGVEREEATACDPRDIKDKLDKEHGIKCWLDVEQTGKKGLYEDITEGLRAADVVVAFVSNDYLNSNNCMMELRFAVSTLKLPVIFVGVGTGKEWQYEEIGTLQRHVKAPVLDMCTEVTEKGMKELVDFIQKHILSPDKREEKRKKLNAKRNKISIVNMANMSYHEEFELAQRKVFRRIMYLASLQNTVSYPRLFTLDFMDEVAAVREGQGSKQRPDSAARSLTRRRSNLTRRESVINKQDIPMETEKPQITKTMCVRFLCEHDQGWHTTDEVIELSSLTQNEKESLILSLSPYLARMGTLLEHSSVPLNCLHGNQGAAFKQYLIKLAVEGASEDGFERSYKELHHFVMQHDKNMNRGSLRRCLLSGGRVHWLCPEHQKGYRVTVLTTDVSERHHGHVADSKFYKGVVDGLHRFADKHYRSSSVAASTTNKTNIANVITVAHLDSQTPRIDDQKLDTGRQMMFETAKSQTHAGGEEEEEDTFGNPIRPPSAMSAQSSLSRPSSAQSQAASSTFELSRPPSARSQSGQAAAAGKKKDKLKKKTSKATLSAQQTQAAQRAMAAQQLMSSGHDALFENLQGTLAGQQGTSAGEPGAQLQQQMQDVMNAQLSGVGGEEAVDQFGEQLGEQLNQAFGQMFQGLGGGGGGEGGDEQSSQACTIL